MFRGLVHVTRMRFGVLILPEERWATARPRWETAERLGFDHAWTYDHLAWRDFRDSAWFGAVPTLTAAALATTRIRVGTLVASINFRHPLTLAKEAVALDDISAGRFTLGIGAGSSGWDATMLGGQAWPARERTARFEEFVALTDRLLREPDVSADGDYYAVDEARTFPGCVQRPRIPFAVAASGPRGMRLAARYAQCWVTTGERTKQAPVGAAEGAEDVRRQMERLDQACHEVGRDPASLDRLVVTGPEAGGPVLDSGLASVEAFQDTVGHYGAVGVTDLVVHWPRADAPFAGDLDVFERIFSSVITAR